MATNDSTNSKTQAVQSAETQKKLSEGAVSPGADVGQDQAQKTADTEQEQGYRGVAVDPTPNENYTVAGVTEGKPTPETDPDQAAQAGSTKFAGTEAAEKESAK